MICKIDHVNLLTAHFDETVGFYEAALGMTRTVPASAVQREQNAWLCGADGSALIHVNGPLSGETVPAIGQQSRLNHFALACTGLDAARARLDAAGVVYQQRRIEPRGITQLNLRDPNGILVELTFFD
jgi:catechol 2,3-dioxygenase-like lactoylglutathione lyase family enzyme